MSPDPRKLLDNLDDSLAMREIDFATYQSLKAKYTAQLTQGVNPGQEVVDALPKQVHVLKCTRCHSPLDVRDPATTSVACEYCGTTCQIRVAEDALERLMLDNRNWMATLVGAQGSSSIVDEAARGIIFSDKLLPSLRRDANRANEAFSTVRHAALFSFPLANEVSDSPFLAARRNMPNFAQVSDKLHITEARAEAPEVLTFAVNETNRGVLGLIAAQCRESMRVAHVRDCLMQFDADGFLRTQANLKALREIYDDMAKHTANDPPRELFARALRRRITAVSDATTELALLYREAEGVMTDPIVSKLERIASECEVAALELERSGVEARDRVPAVEGARADAQTIRILRDSVQLFGMCGAEDGHGYPEFARSLSGLASRARGASGNLDWLSGFVDRLAQHVSALNGEPVIATVTDFSTMETDATSAARSSMFGGKESAEVAERMLVPFWMAQLQFSQQTGVIFKKGHAAQELLFVDASTHSGRWLRTSTDSPLGSRATNAVASPTSVSPSSNPLVPVVSSDKALGTLKSIIQGEKGFAGGQPKMLGLVYLPALRAVYSTKKSQRHQLFVGSSQEFGDLTATRAALGTVDLRVG